MDLPPAIELVDAELGTGGADVLAKLLTDKGFADDVEQHAAASASAFTYADEREPGSADALVINPGGALNPFSREDKCGSLGCRLEAADAFARTTALYADYIVTPDHLTADLLAASREPNARRFNAIHASVQVVRHLRPLIDARVIRFAKPGLAFCAECVAGFQTELANAANQLWEEFKRTGAISIEREKKTGDVVATLESILLPEGIQTYIPLGNPTHSPELGKTLAELSLGDGGKVPAEQFERLKEPVTHALKTLVIGATRDAALASRHHSIYAAPSRGQTLAVRALDGEPVVHAHDEWERLRSVNLPWLSDLTVPEIAELRDKASRALAPFRARVFRELGSGNAAHKDAATQAAITLRAEVAELEAELKATKPHNRRISAAGGLFGLGLIIYGIATSDTSAIAGGSALLAGMNVFFHKHGESQSKEELLTARPAYVLLTARDLIRHRETGI